MKTLDATERRIAKLPDDVVRQICAGEVLVRPVHAVKELVENALDAGADALFVSVSGEAGAEGCFSLLEVADDGHGIHENDLPNLCRRFFTSKV